MRNSDRGTTGAMGGAAALVLAALALTGCTASVDGPGPSPSVTESAAPLSDPQVRIVFEWEGEEREVVGEPTQPFCDEGGYINVIGGDSQSSTGVTLRLEDDADESFVAAWVGADDFAVNFQGEGEVTVSEDDGDTLLTVTDLAGTVTAAARDGDADQTFNEAIEDGQRVDGTLSFAVRCPAR